MTFALLMQLGELVFGCTGIYAGLYWMLYGERHVLGVLTLVCGFAVTVHSAIRLIGKSIGPPVGF